MICLLQNVRQALYYYGITCLLLLLVGVYNACAGDPLFSTLSVRDGLPSNIIVAVAQDKHDFLWIGTESGLCRYDGYHFRQFRKTESIHSLPSDEISSLLADRDHIWVGTWKGLCKIDIVTLEITRIELGEHTTIRTLYKDPENILWIGTATGLIRYTITDKTFKAYTSQNSGLSHNTIRSLFKDKHGNLWVGTYDKLNKLQHGKETFVTLDLKGNYKPSLKNNLICGDIRAVSTNADSIWVGTETGLCKVDITTGNYTRYSESNTPFSNEVIKCIYVDDDQHLWLGTDFGLNVFDPANGSSTSYFHNPQLSYSIANNVIWQIFEDRGGVIWFVTSNGLSKLNKYGDFYDYHSISFIVDDQTVGNQVKAFLVTKQGIFWLATLHGAIRIDPKTGDKKIFDTTSPLERKILLNNVFALEEDALGRIWIGTAGGINIWDEQNQKMHSITAHATNGLVSNYIAKFIQGADGSFWVSAWEGGLFKVVGNFNDLSSIAFKKFADIGSEKNVAGAGAIWIVEYDELFRLDLSTYKKKHIPAMSKAANKRNINCLYFSSHGILWIATSNGLIEYNPKSDAALFHPITGYDIIRVSIMEDNEGNIWTVTNNNTLEKFHPANQHIQLFPLDKGLPLKSFFNGCAAKTASGEIIFGGDNGYIQFSPLNLQPNTYKPNVYITALEINNKTVINDEVVDGSVLLDNDISFTREVTLKYAQRSIAFEFSALHYWQPSMNVYAYMLEGLDKDWNYVSGQKNFAVYANLPSGNYTLKVKGTNNYGIWSDHIAKVDIIVKPPLFLSQGFIALYIVLIALMIYYALRIYSARVHLKNELKIARMEKEHAEELEHTKLQFFTNISHELRTPISLILPPIQQILKRGNLDEESQGLITLAEKNSHRLLRLVNQILDFRKLESDALQLKMVQVDMVKFCHEIYSLFTDKAARNEINFTFQSTVNTCNVWADVEKIETVLFNLLSNAFKFTPKKGSVSLAMDVLKVTNGHTKGWLEIKVTDTGVGIAPEEQPKIFEPFYQVKAATNAEPGSGIGLTLTAAYVKLHHGKINVESVPGEHTTFTVVLPIGDTHLPVDPIRLKDEITLLATKSIYEERDTTSNYQFNLGSGKPLVLIIEDNNDMTEFIRLSLHQKYDFIVAENGAEGLQKALNYHPEVIISDVMMPVMDGLTLCKKIKENPKTSYISVILLTAQSLPSQKVEGIRIGADAYITKPFEIEFLEANIDHVLDRKKELIDYFKSELIIQPDNGSKKENVDEKFVKRVMDTIEANVSDPDFSVEALSEEIGMSSTHLYRKLKSLTALSPNEIIKKYRIKKASLLLKNKEGNISEIMYDVGFSNLSYFSKCFKAEYGITPKEYQQRVSKNGVDLNSTTPL